MKKNIFKKVVATLATAAMTVGMFAAMPATDAKAVAGSKETKIVLVVSGNTEFDKIYLDINDGAASQNAGITSSSKVDSTNLGWGRDMYVFEKDATNPNVYTVVTKGTLADGEYCNMQFNFAKNGSLVAGCKYYPQNEMAQFNDNGTLYIEINVDDHATEMWGEVVASTTNPVKTPDKPADADKPAAPDTADSSAVVLMLAVAAVAAGAVIVSRKRTVNE